MIRHIQCEKCTKETKHNSEKHRESCKVVKGKAVHDFLCDVCNEKLPKGSDCCAVSMGIDYYQWENDYLEVEQ